MKYNNKILEAIQRGIKLALDDFEDNGDINQLSSKSDIIKNADGYKEWQINKYFVDLGLPSGTLWAKYNLGVELNKLSKREDWYGNYYAWGEIKPKKVYNWNNYKFGDTKNITKYNKKDKLTQLLPEDDAAIQNDKYNLGWQMPTKKQFNELLKYTTNQWIENYQKINGLNGGLFTSKINGNQLFIPNAGCYPSSLNSCYLWSSSCYTSERPIDSYQFGICDPFFNEPPTIKDDHRYHGNSIRPVLNKN